MFFLTYFPVPNCAGSRIRGQEDEGVDKYLKHYEYGRIITSGSLFCLFVKQMLKMGGGSLLIALELGLR